MFPIGVKPAIQYVVEEALDSGIEHILIIVSRSKSMIVDYFDESLELDTFLEQSNKQHLKSKLQIPKNQLHYTRQPYAKGLGDAIRLGETFIGDEPFAVLLPDDIIVSEEKPGLRELIHVFEQTGSSVIGLKEVEEKFLHQYGVIGGTKESEGIYKIQEMIEKPKKQAPSNLAVVGRYVLNPSIFFYLKKINPGAGGELQLTDAIKELIKKEICFGKLLTGDRYDIGNVNDYINIVNLMKPDN